MSYLFHGFSYRNFNSPRLLCPWGYNVSSFAWAPKRAHALKTIWRSKDRDRDKRELIKMNRRPFNDSAANPKTSHQLCLSPSSRVIFLEPLRISGDLYTRDPSDVVLFLRYRMVPTVNIYYIWSNEVALGGVVGVLKHLMSRCYYRAKTTHKKAEIVLEIDQANWGVCVYVYTA